MFLSLVGPGRSGGFPPFPPKNRIPLSGTGSDSFPSYGSSTLKAFPAKGNPVATIATLAI